MTLPHVTHTVTHDATRTEDTVAAHGATSTADTVAAHDTAPAEDITSAQDTASAPAPTRSPARRRGVLIAGAAVLTGCSLLVVPQLPTGPRNAGSLLQTFLPWLGLAVPLLLLMAAVRRSRLAAAAVLVPAVAWASLFGASMTDKRGTGGDLSVLSHNVSESNRSPQRTARQLVSSGAELIALQEMSPEAIPRYQRALAKTHPHHVVRGGVGLWSTLPLHGGRTLPVMPWPRALRATVDTSKGPVAVYVAHLASVRVAPGGFATARRNEAIDRLAAAVRSERASRVVVAGDLNGSAQDTALRPLTEQLHSAQEEAGAGLGLTWPAEFPLVRIDQILVRGVTPVSSWTLPRTMSDHLPAAASLRL
ncbi:endonuclease/exonuclease/phosphatase family protein [Streptomyces sp. NPDC050703]|uniref:endonuclease/exonuclease/phosphatase family protein n=1 Tax=Streptomyces sp. NPDC050703 TaxID=3157218 RepID=UPI00341B2D93